ncbi:MAG: DedA family protein [Verrucomicrobia bacterium]|nr:DedA family protein [Verrucomicrobiota bacterium]
MDLDLLIQAVSQYRYLAMFGILFVSAMGVPIPEEPLLVASGLSVGWGNSQYHFSVLACLAGILAGDMWVYFLGRRGGRWFLQTRLGSFVFSEKRQQRIERLYEKHGAKTVFLGRFIPAVRFGVFFFAGRHRMPIPKFLGLNALGAMVYTPLWIWLSALAGERFSRSAAAQKAAEAWVQKGSLILIGTVLVVIAVMIWGAGKRKASH